MEIKLIHREWLRLLREDLRSGNHDDLAQHVEEAGLELILDPEFLTLTRKLDVRQLVILIATLGQANADEPAPYARLLAAYQYLQQQLTLDEAAVLCAQASGGYASYYKVLLASVSPLDGHAPAPDVSATQCRVEDLVFGIELVQDAHRPTHVVPLLKAWQRIDGSAMPWLLTCRMLADRVETVLSRHAAAELAQALTLCMDMAPKGQEAVLDSLRPSLVELWVKARRGDSALGVAQTMFKLSPKMLSRYWVLRSLMVRKDVAGALKVADALLQEMATRPDPLDLIEEEVSPLTPHFDVGAAERTLLTVNRALQDRGLKPFLMSGTLLGCVRNNGLLPHDKDVDMGLIGWESQFEAAQALLELGHFHLHVGDLRGGNLFLLSPKDVKNGVAIDLFFFHEKPDHYLHGIDFDFGYTQNYRFSRFDLVEREFLGERFYIPDDYDRNLTENYGDWRTPQTSYVVTVESPGIVDRGGPVHSLSAHLELMKTIAMRLPVLRAQRILDACQATGVRMFSSGAESAMAQWMQKHS